MRLIRTAALVSALFIPAVAQAQTADHTWAAEVFLGWDNTISGNLHGSGVGTLIGQSAVITSSSYDDIYGTGARWRFTGAYRLDPKSEVLGSLEVSTAGAEVRQIGTLGGNPLFAQFGDYKAIGIEGGYRRYFADQGAHGRIKPFVGGLIGIDIISSIDASLTVPQQNLVLDTVNVYDGTGAFVFGVNGGAFYDINERFSVGGQLELRHHTGLDALNGLSGTGLDNVTNDTGRWSLPLTFGARVKF